MARIPCFNRNGEPKRAFATYEEAMAFLGNDEKMMPYSCIYHGYHIGHYEKILLNGMSPSARRRKRRQLRKNQQGSFLA